MRTSQLIAEIEARNKTDPCRQFDNLLKWVAENTPKRRSYFQKYHKRIKDRDIEDLKRRIKP